MSGLGPEYLQYPWRRPGMDHERYPWSNLFERKPVEWPGGARVALWIVPILEFFPIEMPATPFRPPGGIERPHPDYWNYTLRDYGTRVGAFRVFASLDRRGLKASVALSSRLAERHPGLVERVTRRGWEVMAHGVHMGKLHHGGLEEAEERGLVEEAFGTLRRLSSQKVEGWSSPAYSQSLRTPDLVAEAGGRWMADWANDDLPYGFATRAGPIHVLPLGYEITDLRLFWEYKQRPAQYVEQVLDHFRLLYREAGRYGGRMVVLPVRPWITGVPHRIGAFEEALDRILAHAGVWNATGGEILEAWKAQQE
jgi:peptidoglycan/xylan/chitin deacetylase (PgdA/CDA1 family)